MILYVSYIIKKSMESEPNDSALRQSYPVVPPHVEYSLTPLGLEVAKKVEDLADWIEGNFSKIMDAQEKFKEEQINFLGESMESDPIDFLFSAN